LKQTLIKPIVAQLRSGGNGSTPGISYILDLDT